MLGRAVPVKAKRPGAHAGPFSFSIYISIVSNGAKLICTRFEIAKWFGMRVVDWFCTVEGA